MTKTNLFVILNMRVTAAEKRYKMGDAFVRFCKLSVKELPIWILFFGFISTLGGAVWHLLLCQRLREILPLSYLTIARQSIEELTFAAALHILLAIVLFWDIKRKENT